MANNLDLIKGKLTDYVSSITGKSKSGSYICPLCGSGTGRNKSGAFSIDKDGEHFKCFSCGTYGDILDLIGYVEHLSDYGQKLKRAQEITGIKAIDKPASNKPVEKEIDYTSYYETLDKSNPALDGYRGISLEVYQRFRVGYDAEAKNPKNPQIPAIRRIIIPTSDKSYVARAIYNDAEPRYFKVGKMHMLNIEAIMTATKPIHIVEGEFDALSIIEAGGEAVALGSTANINGFITYIGKNRPTQPLIILMDNDEAGSKAQSELAEKLNDLGIIFSIGKLPDGTKCKDANELLEQSKTLLIEAVIDNELQAYEAREEAKEEYLKTSTASYIKDFTDGIKANIDTPCIPTGYKGLDKALDGGLYEGLYIIGAISSLGKTTYIMQMADQIAMSGQDVLVFSLEMARTELMAKSISRNTCAIAEARNIPMTNAKSLRGIVRSHLYKGYSQEELDLIQLATDVYAEYAGHIYISEAKEPMGVMTIRQTVEKHISITGTRPVVVVDYIQILAPADVRATDKQNTDKAVLELKHISRDYKIPLIGISSFNRQNYNEKISMLAFKESGAIEYSSDVLLGMQLQGTGEKGFDVNKAKEENPRKIEVTVLKNRNGKTSGMIPYEYYPQFNYFEEGQSLDEIRDIISRR